MLRTPRGRGACSPTGPVSELEFLNALGVEMVRHRELRAEAHTHELFQTSTIEALLGGAFDGDVALSEILDHGDLGLGTLNGLDGELIVIDGKPFKANPDCTLSPATGSSKTPYAVVVQFSPGPPITLGGPVQYATLGQAVGHRLEGTTRPVAVRIDGRSWTSRDPSQDCLGAGSEPRNRSLLPQTIELGQSRRRSFGDVESRPPNGSILVSRTTRRDGGHGAADPASAPDPRSPGAEARAL